MNQGDQYSVEISYTQAEVEAFAKLTGDANPLHLDSEYAATTAFRRPIMHGMLAASVFSKILGMEFPGEGTIYLKQSLEFKKPMYVDTAYRVACEATEVNQRRGMATILTLIFDDTTGQVVLSGEATIINKKKIKKGVK